MAILQEWQRKLLLLSLEVPSGEASDRVYILRQATQEERKSEVPGYAYLKHRAMGGFRGAAVVGTAE